MAEISPVGGKLELEMGVVFVVFVVCTCFFKFYMSYIPCIIGFPVEAIEFTPMQTKSPKPVFAV